MGKIFCFMGKSSSGKDTIFKKVLRNFPGFEEIVLYTTRPIRAGEVDGVNYYFVDNLVYKQMMQQNLIIESRSYNTVHGVWIYFTSAKNIDLDNKNYMIINTLEGYAKLKEYFGEENIIPIYIEVDDYNRLLRAIEREKVDSNPKYNELCRRFLADSEDFSEEKILKNGINRRYINNDLNQCISEIENDIYHISLLDRNKTKKKDI